MDIWNTKQKYLIISTVKYKEIPEDTALLKKAALLQSCLFFGITLIFCFPELVQITIGKG